VADRILSAFLERQHAEASLLAASSDLLQLRPVRESGARPPEKYVARYLCTGLVKDRRGRVVEANDFSVGIWLPPDYLVRVDPLLTLTWFEPWTVFHPNIRPPYTCVGRIAPGTPLVDLLYQLFELITYTKVTMREDDALNRDACVWARQHVARFPVDRRPLKRLGVGRSHAAAPGTGA
jgi:hypothetical protein